MSKIEITRAGDHLKVGVLSSKNVLIGYAYVGSDGAGGYQINRVESWAGKDNKVSIKGNVLARLSAARFNKEMA